MGCDKKFQGERTYLVAAAMMLALAGCDAGESDDGGGSISYTGSTDSVDITDATDAKTASQIAVGYAIKRPIPGLVAESAVNIAIYGFEGGGNTCPAGGTVAVNANVAEEGVHTVGDRYTVGYSGCSFSSSDYTFELNGAMTFTVTEVIGDAYYHAGDWSLGLKLEFDGVSYASSNTDGDGTVLYEVEMGGTATRTVSGTYTTDTSEVVTGSEFVAVTAGEKGGEEWRLSDFSFHRSYDTEQREVAADTDFAVASTSLGGNVTVDTITPFRWSPASALGMIGYGSPVEGVLVITSGSAKVKVAVETYDYVEVYEDLNGDGTWEGHTQYPASDFFN